MKSKAKNARVAEDFPVSEAEEKIGYVFKDKSLLIRAFTHSTYAHEHGGEDNERLEFLGDAVLQLVVSENLYGEKEKFSEGEMTSRRQQLVNGEALKEAVQNAGIYPLLRYSGSKGGNLGEKTISSLFESVIAAIYLDDEKDGYENAKRFAERFLDFSRRANYKGDLQEYLQSEGKSAPTYTVVEKSGAENKPVFLVKASAEGLCAEGKGGSKKAAEQEAAKKLAVLLKNNKL